MFSEPKHIPSSERETMRGFRSLTAKYIFLGLIIIALITSFTVLSFIFTSHIDNDARRINIAGRERMLSFKIAWLLNKAVSETGEERITTLNALANETLPLFEGGLYALRDGSEKYGIKPLSNKNDLLPQINILIKKWQQKVKPLLAGAIKNIEQGETASIKEYNVFVRGYVTEIDTFVGYLVEDYESELRVYGTLRIVVIGLSILIFVVLGLFVRKWLVIPIIRLRETAQEIEKGNFDVRLDIKSRDEIGLLTDNLNQMAQTLHRLFDEKLRHIKEVLALADSSNFLNALPLQENIHEAICKVAVRNFNLKMAWLGLVDEKTYDVNPVAHAGLEDGYLSSVRFTWSDPPEFISPTCLTLRSRIPEVIHMMDTYPVDTPWKLEALKRGYHSSLSVPLISSEGKEIGVINLYSGDSHFFTKERVNLFHTFGNQVAIAVENRRQIGRLNEQISLCVQAHSEISELYQKNEDIVNTIDGIVWEADARTFQFLFVSKKAEKILGYPIEYWLTNPLFCKDHIHPEDREWAVSFCAKATSEKRSHELEYRAIGPDGRVVWLRNIVTVVVREDKPIRLQGIMVDVTEWKKAEDSLKESEERYRNLVENAKDVIHSFSIDGTITYLNPVFEAITGWSCAEWIGKHFQYITHPDDLPIAIGLFQGVMRGETPPTFELRILTKSGEYITAEFILLPQFYEGKVVSVFGIARDITERKKEKEEIRQSLDTQFAIRSILQLSLENTPFEKILNHTLDIILSIPWLSFESKGGILLVEDDPNRLIMKAQKGLAEYVQKECAMVPFGKCLCGQAALTREIQFTDKLDAHHEVRYEGISPHGHYCVPIMYAGVVLGVITIYLKEGHQRSEKEEDFLKAVANAIGWIIKRKNIEREREKLMFELQTAFTKISHSSKEWQNTFDNITDLVSIHDRDFNIIKANKAFEKQFGLHPREVINRKCYEIFHRTDSPVSNCPHKMTCNELRPVNEEIMDPKTSRIFRVSTFPYYSPEGELIGSIHIAKDTTEEREKEMRLIMSERLASLGQIASGIAHEINNPLAAIAACTEGLLSRVKKGRFESEFFENYLKIIEEEISRCKGITTSMLSFVRKTTYEKKEININETLDKTVAIIGLQGRLRDVKVIKNYKDGIPVIHGNDGELRQVFLSIITNAIDAMEDSGTLILETGIIPCPPPSSTPPSLPLSKGRLGGVPTVARGDLSESEGEFVFIKITDTGPGMLYENINRIFDPFFTTKSESGGTGIGLSIARRIINNHNGSIDVTSEQGRGTTLMVTLPV